MSIGYGGYADLQLADDSLVVYAYCCYNVNNSEYRRYREIEDGELYIERDAFVEPEIHEKQKRLPSGKRRTIIKRIMRDVPIDKLVETGKIKVKNASGTWMTTAAGIDRIAMNILMKLFYEYQKTGVLPLHIGLYS